MRQRGERGGHLDQSDGRFTTSTWNWMSPLISTPSAFFFSPALPFVLTNPITLPELDAALTASSSSPHQHSHSFLVSHSPSVFVFPSN